MSIQISPQVIRNGLLNMQLCVPNEWDDNQIITFAQWQNPAGTTTGWCVTPEGHETLAGSPARVTCAQRKRFIHVLVHV